MSNETLPQDPEPKKPEGEKPEENEGGQGGGENVSDSISLADLNAKLGKEFKDVDSAIKSLKDTQSFVGKKIEKAKEDPSVKEQLDNLASRLNESDFYRNNPQYDNKETRNLIKEIGGDPSEVVEKDVFKSIFEKTSAYDKSQESKSVLHNSSRLGQASTKMDDANSAMNKANDEATKGNITEALRAKANAEEDAINSVIDSFSE